MERILRYGVNCAGLMRARRKLGPDARFESSIHRLPHPATGSARWSASPLFTLSPPAPSGLRPRRVRTIILIFAWSSFPPAPTDFRSSQRPLPTVVSTGNRIQGRTETENQSRLAAIRHWQSRMRISRDRQESVGSRSDWPSPILRFCPTHGGPMCPVDYWRLHESIPIIPTKLTPNSDKLGPRHGTCLVRRSSSLSSTVRAR